MLSGGSQRSVLPVNKAMKIEVIHSPRVKIEPTSRRAHKQMLRHLLHDFTQNPKAFDRKYAKSHAKIGLNTFHSSLSIYTFPLQIIIGYVHVETF